MRSLVHSKLSFGAGLWVLTSNAEHEAFQHSFMTHWRQSCKILLGVGCKFLNDSEICCLLGVAEPMVIHNAAKLRQLRDGPGSLWQCIDKERTWLAQALVALREVATVLALQLDCITQEADMARLSPLVPHLSAWAARYVKTSVEQSAQLRDSVMLKAKGLAKPEQSGGVQLKLPDACNAGIWQCELCSRVCRTNLSTSLLLALGAPGYPGARGPCFGHHLRASRTRRSRSPVLPTQRGPTQGARRWTAEVSVLQSARSVQVAGSRIGSRYASHLVARRFVRPDAEMWFPTGQRRWNRRLSMTINA